MDSIKAILVPIDFSPASKRSSGMPAHSPIGLTRRSI